MTLKKILSALLSGLLLFHTAAIMPVFADEIPSTYKYIDTCYSPDLDLYVAIAKDFTTKTNPAQVFVSDDVENWRMVRKFQDATHNANPENRQTIVWWEAEQKFVMSVNNKIFYSSDGDTWTQATNSAMANSNTTVETNGQQLVLSSGSSLKIFNSLDDEPQIYKIDSGAYGKTVGLTPDEPMRYAVTDQWKTWQFDAEGAPLAQASNMTATPLDMVYVPNFGGWIVVNNTAVLRVLNRDAVRYTNFTAMQLSDGTTNTEKFTAVALSTDHIAVGTANGKILIARNVPEALTVDVPWVIAQPGGETENTEQIRSISAVKDGMFLAVSDTKKFMVVQDGDEWKYYDTSSGDMVLENTRFEIPETDTFTTVLEPIHYDYKGSISADEITSFEPISQLPDGVASEPVGNSAAQLSIDSSVVGGHEITYRATTAMGKTRDFTITIVDEDHITVEGQSEMAIPLSGEEDETYTYTASVIGTDGKEMSRKAIISMESMPEGIEFDSDSHIFTVPETAEPGEIKMAAYSQTRPENKTEKTILVSKRQPKKIELVEPEKDLFIPDSGAKKFAYTAKLYDQIGKEMPKAKIVWSMEPKQPQTLEGVTMKADTGELSVLSSVVQGELTIRAAAAEDETVFAEQEVSLNYTDLRMAKEDLSEIKLDPTQAVTGNLDLLTQGTFESTFRWRSSNESLIKADGTVTRPSREDQKVTLTVTVSKNTSLVEKKYDLTVKKADNLCTNGDLSDGTANGWKPKNETELSIVSEEGKNLLKVAGEGAYQVIPMTNDSSYGFIANVKADKGSVITLRSEKGGNIATLTADGNSQVLKANYDYRKQKDQFEDQIYLECNGDLYIEQLTVYEITLELTAVTDAVNKAAYSKSTSDINAAKQLLNTFYDLPIRDELLTKLNKIKPSSSNNNNGGGGGGGGGGSTSPSNIKSNNDLIPITPNQDPGKAEDELDTYLLHFKDMKTHWARNEVEAMAELGIVNGNEQGDFNPNDNVSRAEFAAMVTRTMGLEPTAYENSFFDVIDEDWYSGYVQTVRSNDYMNGYDGLFNPHNAITREEIAKVIVAAYNSKSNTKMQTGRSLYFNDIDEVSYWAYDYIAEAAEQGFVNGVTEELFAPKQYASRAQAVVMLKRVYDKLHPAE